MRWIIASFLLCLVCGVAWADEIKVPDDFVKTELWYWKPFANCAGLRTCSKDDKDMCRITCEWRKK